MSLPNEIPTLLVIEDEKLIITLLSAILSGCFRMIFATTYNDAVECVIKYHNEVCGVLLDGKLHDEETVSLVHLLKEYNFDKKIIAMSGNPGTQKDLILNGCFEHGLPKPFDVSKVWEVLKLAGITAARTT